MRGGVSMCRSGGMIFRDNKEVGPENLILADFTD